MWRTSPDASDLPLFDLLPTVHIYYFTLAFFSHPIEGIRRFIARSLELRIFFSYLLASC